MNISRSDFHSNSPPHPADNSLLGLYFPPAEKRRRGVDGRLDGFGRKFRYVRKRVSRELRQRLNKSCDDMHERKTSEEMSNVIPAHAYRWSSLFSWSIRQECLNFFWVVPVFSFLACIHFSILMTHNELDSMTAEEWNRDVQLLRATHILNDVVYYGCKATKFMDDCGFSQLRNNLFKMSANLNTTSYEL